MSDVTRILTAAQNGDACAARELLPLVYEELRRLAASRLRHESPDQTLQATGLVHEAYVRLVGPADLPWANRAHFFAAAAEAMRRILVDRARARGRGKRGGDFRRLSLNLDLLDGDEPATEILALDEALESLAAADPSKAELVKLRFYAGLSLSDAATALGISRATAARHWAYARAWLCERLRDSG